MTAGAAAHLPIRRNTILLAASLAVNTLLFQLAAAVNSLTFVEVTGATGLLGLGPAIFLAASGLAALPAGRAMDHFGRIPVIVVGFLIAAAGALLIALATRIESTVAVVVGMALTGAAGGVALLIRTAAGDMYPPERRARGISYVLFGSVFGAVLGPAVFGPLFAGKDVSADSLTLPWVAAAGAAFVALAIVLFVRPDPKRIAEELGVQAGAGPPVAAAPLREIVRRPGVLPTLAAAVASFAVMVSVMNLTGYVVVHEHGHPQDDVFPIIGAHVLGMFALVLFIGPVVDRIGRPRSLYGGLVLMAVACAGLALFESVVGTSFLLFALGLGWSLSFVAATAQLADAAAPSERGRLLGFVALAVGATVLVLLPFLRAAPRLATIAARRA
jgi:MFS family permease